MFFITIVLQKVEAADLIFKLQTLSSELPITEER